MKVTKSNLKRIINEEIKNVDDLTKWAEKEMFEKLLLTIDSSRGPLRGKYNKKYAKLRYGFDSPEQAQKAFKKYALRILKNSGGDKNKFFDLVDDWITSTKKKLPDPYKGGGLVSGDPKRKAKYKKRFTQSFGEPFAETKRKFKLFKNITDAWREPALRTTKTVHMSREEAVKKGIISQVWDPKTPARGFFDTRAAQDSQFWIQGRTYKDFKSMTGTDVIFANETNFEADDMMFGMYGFAPSKLKDKKQAERITRQLESNGFEKDKNGIYWSPTVLVSMQVQTHQRFPQLKEARVGDVHKDGGESAFTMFQRSIGQLKPDGSYPWAHKPGDPGVLMTGAQGAGETKKQWYAGFQYLRDLIAKNVALGKISIKPFPKQFKQSYDINIAQKGLKPGRDVKEIYNFVNQKIDVKASKYFGDGVVTYWVHGTDMNNKKYGSWSEYKLDAGEIAKYEKLRPYAKNIKKWAAALSKMKKHPAFRKFILKQPRR
jgi:hypothetical protein